MKKIYLFANWKMYLDATESAALAHGLKGSAQSSVVTMVVFPTALAIPAVLQEFSGSDIGVGAQNVYWVDKGGVTGEISAAMFAAAGCQFALVGHSERRHLFGETNHDVRQKIDAIAATNMTPVLCVGETKAQRDAGETSEVLETQIRSALTDLVWNKERKFIFAYEPVWAVGTGVACEPPEAERVASLIAVWATALLGSNFNLSIIYGGSARPDNVAAYLKEPHLSGVLVGAASTHRESWLEIARAV